MMMTKGMQILISLLIFLCLLGYVIAMADISGYRLNF